LLQGQTSQYLAITVDDFKGLLNRIAGTFKTQKELADALDIDPSRLSRAINAGDFPFNVENCLRLAKLSGEPPSAVLRAAGKADIAELIESLYGPEKTVTDPVVVSLIENWDQLTSEKRNFLDVAAQLLLMSDLHWERTNVPFTLGVGAGLRPIDPAQPIIEHEPAAKRGGRSLAVPVNTADDETDSVPGTARATVRRVAAGLVRLAGKTQPAGTVEQPARPARAVRQHDAAPRAAKSRRRAPGRKPRG